MIWVGIIRPATRSRASTALSRCSPLVREDVGMVVKVTGGRLLVGPSARLTSADVTAIRGHRDELIEIVQMCVAEVM